MASIYWNQARTRWYARYKDHTGKHRGKILPDAPRRPDLTKRERMELQLAALQIEEDQEAVAPDEIDLDSAAAVWLEQVRVTTRYPTRRFYKAVLVRFTDFLCPGGERLPLRAVTPTMIRAYRDARLKEIQPVSVRTELIPIGSFLTWCWKQEWIAENPALRVERPPKRTKPVVVPTDAQVIEMLDTLREEGQDRFYLLALLGAAAGMRVGDILWLKPEHVDLEAGVIGIWQGKSKQPRRVPMSSEVRAFLQQWPMDGEYVCPNEFACTPESRSRRPGEMFNLWLKDHGYNFTHKSLRHYWVNRLRLLGLDLAARKLIAGHQDDAVNLIYSHPVVDETRPFVERVLVRPGAPPQAQPESRPAAG